MGGSPLGAFNQVLLCRNIAKQAGHARCSSLLIGNGRYLIFNVIFDPIVAAQTESLPVTLDLVFETTQFDD